MQITLNGKKENIADQMTIMDLLKKYKLDPKTIIVEKNMEIIEKQNYDQEIIQPADNIELIRFMGGG